MATHEVRVDYAKSLTEEPETGHNRWHPDIAPVVACDPGDEVVLDTRDAFDGQMGPEATLETVAATQPQRRPPPHRAGVRQRGRAGRPARGRDRGGRAGPLRLHRAGARLRVPARPVPRPVHGPLAHRGRLGHLRRPAGSAHPRVTVHGHHRAVARPGPDGADHRPRAGRHRPGRVRAAAGPDRRRPLRPGDRQPRPCGPSRPGRPPATSTSSSSARAPSCSSRSTRQAGCSRPATPTSPRATTRPAAPPSRCARP